MCPKCEGLAARIDITNLSDLFHRIDEIRQFVKQGTLVSAGGNFSIDEIKPDVEWPADIIEHAFQCVACNQRLELWIDTYHGRGEWHAK